jgi:hypothetical protein
MPLFGLSPCQFFATAPTTEEKSDRVLVGLIGGEFRDGSRKYRSRKIEILTETVVEDGRI